MAAVAQLGLERLVVVQEIAGSNPVGRPSQGSGAFEPMTPVGVVTEGDLMTHPFEPLRLLAGLRAHGVEYVLVGGLASAAHGSRITMDDVDIAIPPEDDVNLANLGLALSQLGAEPVGELDAHRSSYDTSAGRLDIIEMGEAYFGLRERADDEDLGNGIVARVASMPDLMDLKRRSGDLATAAHLAALAHGGGSESEFDDPVEDREWPEWMNRVWHKFEDVDAYLTRVVYGDGKRIHS